MSIVTCDLTITLDGYAAGPSQTEEQTFGKLDADLLHAWMFDRAAENVD